MSEPTNADHDDRGTGVEVRQDLLDRPVGRETRVGERRGGHRVEPVERDQETLRRHMHQLRIATGRHPQRHVAALLVALPADAA